MSTTAIPRPATARGWVMRAAWLLSALFWSVFAVLEGVNHGLVAVLFAIGFLAAPDLTMLVGARAGGLAHVPAAWRACRRPGARAAAAACGSFLQCSAPGCRPARPYRRVLVTPGSWPPAFAALCGWLAHISWDRVLGYGLRTKDGHQRS